MQINIPMLQFSLAHTKLNNIFLVKKDTYLYCIPRHSMIKQEINNVSTLHNLYPTNRWFTTFPLNSSDIVSGADTRGVSVYYLSQIEWHLYRWLIFFIWLITTDKCRFIRCSCDGSRCHVKVTGVADHLW